LNLYFIMKIIYLRSMKMNEIAELRGFLSDVWDRPGRKD